MDIVRLSVLLTLIAIAVSACVEPKRAVKPLPAVFHHQRVLDDWTGRSLNRLVKEWGFPQETYSTKDIKYVVYRAAGWWQEKPSYLPEWQVACVYTWEVSRKNDIILRGSAKGFGCPVYSSDPKTRDTKIWNPQNRNWKTDH